MKLRAFRGGLEGIRTRIRVPGDLFEPHAIPVLQAARSTAPATASPAARPSASAVSDGELLVLAQRGLSLRRIAWEAGLSHETVRQRLGR